MSHSLSRTAFYERERMNFNFFAISDFRVALYYLPAIGPIIGRFFCDKYVMRMAFAQTGVGDAHEARLVLHFGDGGAARVAHRLAQPADELKDKRPQHSFIRDARLDALGNQAGFFDDVALKVAVFAVAAL